MWCTTWLGSQGLLPEPNCRQHAAACFCKSWYWYKRDATSRWWLSTAALYAVLPCEYNVSNIQAIANWLLKHCMQCNALHSLTQPCLTAYCIWCNTPVIQACYQALQISVSLGKCIWIQSIKETLIVDMASSSSAACEPQTQSWVTLMVRFVCNKRPHTSHSDRQGYSSDYPDCTCHTGSKTVRPKNCTGCLWCLLSKGTDVDLSQACSVDC